MRQRSLWNTGARQAHRRGIYMADTYEYYLPDSLSRRALQRITSLQTTSSSSFSTTRSGI